MITEPGDNKFYAEILNLDQDLAQGNLIAANDRVRAALEGSPGSAPLLYRQALTWARLGRTTQALALYDRWTPVSSGDRSLDIDIAALKGRLLKDVALASPPSERPARLIEAAKQYGLVFAATRDPYPGVNAAALYAWAGDAGAARRCAIEALHNVKGDDFYSHATRAECELILGHPAEARQHLEHAATAGGDPQARAIARQQMRRTCRLNGVDGAILDIIRPPAVVRFLGHMIGPRFPAANERQVAQSIRKLVSDIRPGYAYGALAAGGDILFAEALIEAGTELNVVLPFAVDAFKSTSVAPSGEAWLQRFDRCLARASSLRFATKDDYLGDDSLFAFGSAYASGLAVMRAETLDEAPTQLAVWDGRPPGGHGGTAHDVLDWHRKGYPQRLLSPAGDEVTSIPALDWSTDPLPITARHVQPVVFGDVAGFSKLRESQIRVFMSKVFGAYGAALAPHANGILSRNTWGDGLFLVFDHIRTAVAAALDLSDAASRVDCQNQGLPQLGLRLGAHLAPMLSTYDPISQRETWVGVEVSQASRIEPIVPTGAIYVSEPFAAVAMLEPRRDFTISYVGCLETAKGAGSLPLYQLSRSAAPLPAA